MENTKSDIQNSMFTRVETTSSMLVMAATSIGIRNYAHHIGSHVKMRTTPREIKKRIKELYGIDV